jgi:3',5'-cyclic AMP phosphodiesterase CpdA
MRAGNAGWFLFVQLSDTHWGFEGPPNPEAANTLKKAVATVNALEMQPDLIVFTGDLTTPPTTQPSAEADGRLPRYRRGTQVRNIRYLPAARRSARCRRRVQGILRRHALRVRPQGHSLHRARQCLGPGAKIGDAQLEWLKSDLAKVDRSAPIIAHAPPLFDLAPKWDWATRDGAGRSMS